MGNRQKVALVTVAGSGIGRAVSLALQAAGYSVALAGRRAEELKRTASLAKPSGGEMLPIPTDVTNSDSVRSLFGQVLEAFGRSRAGTREGTPQDVFELGSKENYRT
jgi:NAD(P)-dependent dehydrogenase (short-subunit alcohol dehydrogenase family)